MMSASTHISVASVVLGLVCLAAPGPVSGADSVSLSGAITGLVTDGGGVPQMGAAVMLFNRQDRLFEKVFTDEKGVFSFAGLLPDIYSIRVTLASFVPAIRDNILVQPGMRSALNVSMATLFSSIRLVYPADQPVFMMDDWKWVLRTANSTRPVLRLLPNVSLDEPKPHRVVFSDTRGLLFLSAGDGAPVSGFGSSADMGTAFAVGTSIFGTNQLQFAGNVGSGAQSGIPSAAFRTTYSRDLGSDSPEVSVTMRELFLPGAMAAAIFGTDSGAPLLRSVSVNFSDHAQISDALSLEYGAALDSISFMDHLSYFSPYAKLTYSLGNNGAIEFDYTTGNARPASAAGTGGLDNQLQQDVDALGQFPLVSLRGGHAEVQRGDDFEMGYSRTVGSRRFSVSAYHESVSNLALTIASPDGFLPAGDILPAFFSSTAMFDAGNFSSMGYLASVAQKLGDHVTATVTYGSMGALTTERGELVSQNPDELRSMIHVGRQPSVTTRLDATVPRTGTHIVASYQWADNRWATPDALDCARGMRPEPGFNIYVRQPIPGLSVLPWRMEVTADLRNLLQQGYLPLSTMDGGTLVLMETPRMLRGGLSFIF
jgi:hypothetical protein